ncbi:MAG TPA: HlyD family secretion protein [Polyangiaceae bacterium]|jgi:membrane fusion protein (multidrug efflux system)
MAQDSVSAAGPAAPASVTPAPKAAGSRRPLVIGVVVLVLAAAGVTYWAHSRRFEDTDDAQVDGNISNVGPRITGTVTGVFVSENQVVKAGDPLLEVDPTDLQIAVDQARAQVAQAQALLDAEDPSVPITQTSNTSAVSTAQSDVAGAQSALSAAKSDVAQFTAQLAQAMANDRQAQLEKARSEKLVKEGAVSQSDTDQRVNAAAATSAAVAAIQGSLDAAKARVAQQVAQIGALGSHLTEITANAPRQVATRKASVIMRQAALDLAKAQLAQAEKNLSYAKIVAPVGGVVAKKSVAVGDHVAPGQLLVAISQLDGLWVTADYRETQLELVHPGQFVKVHVDALDTDLKGQVESIGGATGSKLSILPPENASGNYVKVVQRIPVRVKLDGGQNGLDRLRIGMSVESQVTVR